MSEKKCLNCCELDEGTMNSFCHKHEIGFDSFQVKKVYCDDFKPKEDKKEVTLDKCLKCGARLVDRWTDYLCIKSEKKCPYCFELKKKNKMYVTEYWNKTKGGWWNYNKIMTDSPLGEYDIDFSDKDIKLIKTEECEE